MARAIGALKICQRKLAQHQVRHMRIVATEACRRASNGGEFLNLVKEARNRASDGHHQARGGGATGRDLCAPLVSAKTEQLLVVDIGGGSTGWYGLTSPAWPRPSARAIMRLHQGFGQEETIFPRAKVVDWISVPLGVATLKDLYDDVEDDGARFALMSWYFEEQLAKFSPYVDAADQAREGFQIIGTSGTVTTVAASHLGLKRYDRNKVDGLRMTSDQIDTVIQTYLALGPEGRRNDPRIGRDRHSLIMSGSAILQALLRAWPTDRLSVADRGLREGLLYAQMCRDGVMEDGLL